ncbi:MAG TPA: FKBP-type peptidyl-prolyl cis-trans isomerase [Candidatus Blautia ornithocaccae]|nr:FKBP-type peptidyl-prolyl cis-trans isomerase [Clostridiales bacterium]HJD36318.1 FKBP-type peptidyl-prolyl cis-trans isomerase [Candidatus Blautia ornithocaccae]
MKKENRKLAQQRRAQERKKQEKVRKLKKFLAWFIPGILILLLVIVLVADAVRNSGSEDSQETENTESTSDTSSEDSSSEDSSTEDSQESDTSGTSTLSTDTSLTVEDGDTVNIDYVGSIDGVEFDGGSTNGQGTDLTIGSGLYIDDFEEQLIGSHPGDTVEVNVTFPDDYSSEDLQGQDALFEVTINGIYQND